MLFYVKQRLAGNQPAPYCSAQTIRHPPSVKVVVDIQQSSPSQSSRGVLNLGYDHEKGAVSGF